MKRVTTRRVSGTLRREPSYTPTAHSAPQRARERSLYGPITDTSELEAKFKEYGFPVEYYDGVADEDEKE